MKYKENMEITRKEFYRSKEYMSDYRKKHKQNFVNYSRKFREKHKEEMRKDGWRHYSKGKQCQKCGKKITNYSEGLCLVCRLTKAVCLDPKTKRYRLKNPEKIKARKKLYSAIKYGKVIRGNCCVCGKVKAEAHHDDYTKPLNVIWYCRKHHYSHGHTLLTD